MSSPEVESFEVTDYDLENEFNMDRPSFRQTKKSAIYGMFAGDIDDSEEDERPSFGSGTKGKKSYSAPIGFISGGLKKTAEEEVASSQKKEQADDQGEKPFSLSNVDYTRKPSGKQKTRRSAFPMGNAGRASGTGDWERHTKGMGMKLLQQMGYVDGKGLGKNLQGISTPVEAKLRKGRGAIGMYGSERTERSLEDFPRKEDEDRKEEKEFKQQLSQWKKTGPVKPKTQYSYKTMEEVVAKGPSKKRGQQRKGKKVNSTVKVIDMTGREQKILSGYHELAHRHAQPDSDVEFEEDDEGVEGVPRVFEMPELLHNLNMLVDMTEDEILSRERDLRYQKDTVTSMEHEHTRLTEVCTREEDHIDRLDRVFSIVERFENRSSPSSPLPLTLHEAASMFKELKEDYYSEYVTYELDALAVAVVIPMMQVHLQPWDPLGDAKFAMETFQLWKDILDEGGDGGVTAGDFENMDAYQRLVWDAWVPLVRKAIISVWNTRSCDPLIELMESWLPLLPPLFFTYLLDQLILPRLAQAVNDWDPLKDTVAIHTWLHPWLPLLDAKLEPLFAPIRQKLTKALSAWEPADGSALIMIRPWFNVFSSGHMEALLNKAIVPKLASALRSLVINPRNQRLDAWQWVMAWSDLLSQQTLVSLFDQNFYPAWHKVLAQWLITGTTTGEGSGGRVQQPDYEEIAGWFQGWKGMLPAQIVSHPTIKGHLGKAMAAIDKAGQAPPPPPPPSTSHPTYYPTPQHQPPPPPPTSRPALLRTPPPPPPPVHRNTDRPVVVDYGHQASAAPIYRPPAPRPARPRPPMPSRPTVDFGQLLRLRAQSAGLEFSAVGGDVYAGHQVFAFGPCSIYHQGGMVYVRDERSGSWEPVSVTALVNLAVNMI